MTTPTANPRDYVYDAETYPNVFTLSAKHLLTGSRWRFEYSHRRDDRPALFQWLTALRSSGSRMVGFNNVSFDYPLLHWMLANPQATTQEIYQHAMTLINVEQHDRFSHIIWDRDRYVEQLDLYLINHFDNQARRTSLKVLEFNMRSDSIEDLPFEPGRWLSDPEIDVLLDYNEHDVDETTAFYLHCLPAIRFREELTEKYGRNFMNDNDTKIGKQYFIMRLEEAAPGTCYETGPDGRRQPRQTRRDSIALGSVIFSWIKFKRPEFTAVRDWLADQVITETKGVFIDIPVERLGSLLPYCRLKKNGKVAENLNCVIDGFQFDFGTGGIHGSVVNRILESDALTLDQQRKQNARDLIDKRVADNLWDVPEVTPETEGQRDFMCRYLKYLWERRCV